jgi:hypothetical protein
MKMNFTQSVSRMFTLATALLALIAFGVGALSQAQTAAPVAAAAQSASFCGNQPLCFESMDFAATITEFRTSDGNGFKILDAIVRFQNKTNQPLILGYVDGSASGIDDRGNRYTLNPYGGSGVRGIGILSGNNIDPKFMLRAGGYGDARFELLWRLGQLQGVTYEMEMSIREINRVEGNQFVMGGETLLHYQGLANGAGVAASAAGTTGAGTIPGQAMAGSQSQSPCDPAASVNSIAGATNSASVQNAATSASSTASNASNQVNNAASAFSNLGSIFGHKKSVATGGTGVTNAASIVPCASPSTGATSPVAYGTASSTTGTATPQAATIASPTATAPVTTTKTAVIARPTPVSGTTTTVAAKPAPVTGSVKTAVPPAAKVAAQPAKPAAKPAPTTAATKPVQ